MRALRGGTGPQWDVAEVPVPEPGPGELLVRVRAAGVNRADLLALAGGYPVPHADPDGTFTAGMELAGEVVGAGPGTAGRGLGDRVLATAPAAFADYAVVDARRALPVPAGLAWTDAAALPVALETVHDALVTQAGFDGGAVLVLGGTTGVGQVAIRLAAALGAAPVLATTTSPAKAGSLRSAGAEPLVGTDGLATALREATGGAGVDVVLDLVGGDHLAAALGGIRIGGTAVQIGRLAGPAATLDLNTLSFRRLRLIGTTFSVRGADERAAVAGALTPVLDLVADGRVRATVDRVVPLAEAATAADLLRSGEVTGKVVLDLSDAAAAPL
ncbi:alcohol dehydrogenase [Pseudonocardia sp. EC080610-09]|uniref:zinc-binding dehydrogenase n=1 Tax=unclassified Pseudonocardia TaxID=2619320 RepID=UPI0006CB0D68|nr:MULTISPECIES: zinc-binding dehydrogenase [unclassified Pseudonocardia]ALE73828.1 alcohol dehydrogenase [Pseudonocardia sp. EC080625-04]ALL77220.1 alcohol dehydrogenase [Pseudonocardia sp. EC080610-09]ALL80135.1 alcohol dehydrogenase [Pseudonocardia sp. EC080619-01]